MEYLPATDDLAAAMFEALPERGLWPWRAGESEAPRWHCGGCSGGTWGGYVLGLDYEVTPCGNCNGTCVVDVPTNVRAIVTAALFSRTMPEIVALARTIAGDASATVVLRVENAATIADHHRAESRSMELDSAGAWTPATAFSREQFLKSIGNVAWPTFCPYDEPSVRAAWPAMDALRRLGGHLFADGGERVIVAVAEAGVNNGGDGSVQPA